MRGGKVLSHCYLNRVPQIAFPPSMEKTMTFLPTWLQSINITGILQQANEF